jgi:hypothetical protein
MPFVDTFQIRMEVAGKVHPIASGSKVYIFEAPAGSTHLVIRPAARCYVLMSPDSPGGNFDPATGGQELDVGAASTIPVWTLDRPRIGIVATLADITAAGGSFNVRITPERDPLVVALVGARR